MRVFINDLSLAGKFPDRAAVAAAFVQLVDVRGRSAGVARALYCSRSLLGRRAVGAESLSTTLNATLSRDRKVQVLQWIGRHGPFLDDDRQFEENDFFSYLGEDVTDQGLGEAARRLANGAAAAVFSFAQGSDIDFGVPQLAVVHGLEEEPYGVFLIRNILTTGELQEAVEAVEPEPETWTDLLSFCRERFDRLEIGQHCDRVLAPHPFHPNVARRTVELLGVLQSIMQHMNADGTLTALGEEIRQKYFVGERARFSDESARNKIYFSNEMTFPDPADGSASIQCFWHGKIQTPQYRIHFEWPVRVPTASMKVAYIGPKLSKR